MAEPTVTASLAGSFLTFAVRSGADRRTLLEASGLTHADLQSPDGRVAMADYGALIGTAIALTGDGALVMRHAAATTVDALSVVGLIVEQSGSIEAWVEDLNRYTRLIADVDVADAADRYRLVEERGQLWFEDHLPDPNEAPAAIEDTFTRIIVSFRTYAPDRPFALAAEVTYPRPAHAAAYDEILGIPVRFDARRNAIQLHRSWLGTRLSPVNAYARDLFTQHADRLLSELAERSSVQAQLERWMLAELSAGAVSMDRAARQLGMSRQTLYRRLKEEGLTFAAVHDGLRDRLACDLLGARKVSVGEVAHLLGFSEPSSFVRAFRRWTGISPGAFRAGTPRAVDRGAET
ncbi:MAG: AraC family transcriptional regulator ligand-binding domain-containing protein [Myxococcota bacterium]